MIEKNRIGILTTSVGIQNSKECLEFIKQRTDLIQAWTLDPDLAHESQIGMEKNVIIQEVNQGTLRVSSLSGYVDWTDPVKNQNRREAFKRLIDECALFNSDFRTGI